MSTHENGTMKALASGVVGASAVTLLHESARRMHPDAPRMDELGVRGLAKLMGFVDVQPPERDRLHSMAMGADILSNGLFYSMVGDGSKKNVWLKGALLGAAAGIGGVVLPGILGLGSGPSARTPQTKVMTFAWYFAGGLAAAATARCLSEEA